MNENEPQTNPDPLDKDGLITAFNQMDKEELMTISGIGDVLAERILAARPFETLEQIQAVKGLRATLIQKLPDEKTAAPADPEPDSVQEPEAEPADTVNAEPPDAVDKTDKREQTVQPDAVDKIDKREQAVQPEAEQPVLQKTSAREKFSAYFLTALTSIILTLAILGGINGGLRFARQAEHRAVVQEFAQLSDHVAAMQKKIDSLRSRVDTLDGLTDRTVSIEQSQAELNEALDAAKEDLAAIQSDLDDLNTTVSRQDERTLRFEGFLESLQENLNALLGEGVTE